MGRAIDLKQTLLQNILDNADYPNIEFVVLNYNSKDDLHDFMTSSIFRGHRKMGLVRYLRTRAPDYFSMSNSRNVAFRNSTGDIVTNVDADNFTGRGFASYLNRLASISSRRVIFAKGKRRIHGRLGLFKDEFEDIGGYDEDLDGYGYEDHSLMLRAMGLGYRLMWWAGSDVNFMRRIITPKHKVGMNMKNQDWRKTEQMNRELTLAKIGRGELIANLNRPWGVVDDLEVFC